MDEVVPLIPAVAEAPRQQARRTRALNREIETVRKEAEDQAKETEHKFDAYATSKSVSQGMLNTASIQSLITQLVNIFIANTVNGAASTMRPLNHFQIALVSLIGLSLLVQFLVFVLLVILAASRSKQVTETITTTCLNSTVTMLSGVLLIISSAISILSISSAIVTPTTNSTQQ